MSLDHVAVGQSHVLAHNDERDAINNLLEEVDSLSGYDVWLLAGQSNEQGHGVGLDTAYLDTPNPRVLQFANPNSSPVYGDQIVTAIDPLFHWAQWSNGVGHAMTFAKDLIDTLPVNRKILLVPTAQGSTGFSTGGGTLGCWDPAGGFSAPDLYNSAITQANKAMATNPNNLFKGVLWHQGEADNSMTQAAYATKLDALIAGFRSSITGASESLFLIGLMMDAAIAGAPVSYGRINAAHIDSARRNFRCAIFYPPSGITDPTMQNGDNAHFSAKGQRVMGHRAFGVVPLAKANVSGNAPGVPGIPVVSQSGTSITATWDRPISRFTDFNVRYSTNAGVTWTGATRTVPDVDNTVTITGFVLGDTVSVQVQSINEQGTSAWSASGTLTLAHLPGQAGLVLGSPGAFSIPFTITAPTVDSTHSAAVSYLVEDGVHPASVWPGSLTTTQLTGILVGLNALTNYDVRVTAQNAAGNSTSPSTVTSATTTAPNPLLDDVAVTAFRAVGLRKLRSAYAGNCIKVRRSSDNATQNIGFASGTNNLDEAALVTFIGVSDGFIDTWYDQSGNNRNRVQTTAANQMQIATAGVINKVNGKPCASIGGSTVNYSDANYGLYTAGAASSLAVCVSSTVNGASLANEKGVSGVYELIQALGTSGTIQAQIRNDSAVAIATAPGTITTGSALAQTTTTDTGTQLTVRVNAVQSGSVAYSRNFQTITLTASQFGQLSGSGAWTGGKVSEVVEFAIALNSTQYAAGESNQKAYYGTP